jgi:hypothetical protein
MTFVDMPFSYGNALVNTGHNSDLPIEDRLKLVRRSIEDIKRVIADWRAVESNPESTVIQREEAKHRMGYRERDFGGQWENVSVLLDYFEEKK